MRQVEVRPPSARLQEPCRRAAPERRPCYGTLLSRKQYLADIGMWGYEDARIKPVGAMSPEEVAHWTASIGKH